MHVSLPTGWVDIWIWISCPDTFPQILGACFLTRVIFFLDGTLVIFRLCGFIRSVDTSLNSRLGVML
ncbi:hypothetical protein SUGI_0769860, partial [Cryptomeria japonica]